MMMMMMMMMMVYEWQSGPEREGFAADDENDRQHCKHDCKPV
jgi:hypothetical protein